MKLYSQWENRGRQVAGQNNYREKDGLLSPSTICIYNHVQEKQSEKSVFWVKEQEKQREKERKKWFREGCKTDSTAKNSKFIQQTKQHWVSLICTPLYSTQPWMHPSSSIQTVKRVHVHICFTMIT